MIRGGKAFCWGTNTFGQLGNNSTVSSTTPVAAYTGGALAGKTLTQVTAGTGFTCALDSSGAAYCWGNNTNGQLGNNSTTQSNVPVAVTTSGALAGHTLTQVTTGQSLACAVDAVGAAYCWGANGSGQLGDSNNFQSLVPVPVTTSGALAGKTLTQVTAGGAFACALDTAGAGYCWGANGNGQLGNNSTLGSLLPVAVSTSGVLAGKTLTQICAGFNDNNMCALDSSGAAYCWGTNGSGQLGNPATAINFKVPVAVLSPAGTISACAAHTCTVRNGSAFCWGDNATGELGNNSTTQSSVPVAVTAADVLAGKTLTQITTGNGFTCALDSAGAAYCWGNDGSGQLGNNSTTQSTVPVAVTTSGVLAGKTLTQVTAGVKFACALDSTGTAYCWGHNTEGELGNNSTADSHVPVPVTASGVLAGKTLTQITAGAAHACAGYCGSGVLLGG